jgi:tetratricopeptide (TPR) repeat protein
MKRLLAACVVFVAVLSLAHGETKQADFHAAQQSRLNAAIQLIQEGRPAEAIAEQLDPAIAEFRKTYAHERRKIYCSRSEVETIANLLAAASKNIDAVVQNGNWSQAYFLKGFALADLHRIPEAREELERALALSPFNSKYLSERAHLYVIDKNWIEAEALYQRAEEQARATSPEEVKLSELTLALRGQGYVLVETGKLAEAEAKYRECIRLQPSDAKAAAELAYLEGRKGEAK